MAPGREPPVETPPPRSRLEAALRGKMPDVNAQTKPSRTSPVRARRRLTLPWIVLPLAVLAVVAVAFGLRALV